MRTWSKVQTRKPASSASGELESETVNGPMAPATKRGRPVLFAMRAHHSRDFRGACGYVGVCAPAVVARVFHEKFALTDARGGKGVGLDDVSTRLEKTPVNV